MNRPFILMGQGCYLKCGCWDICMYEKPKNRIEYRGQNESYIANQSIIGCFRLNKAKIWIKSRKGAFLVSPKNLQKLQVYVHFCTLFFIFLMKTLLIVTIIRGNVTFHHPVNFLFRIRFFLFL